MAHLQAMGLDVRGATRETSMESLETIPFASVFFCAGNSKTYLATRAPLGALEDDVIALHRYLTRLRFDKWLHVSSSFVYPARMTEKREDAPLPVHELPLYAVHKLLAERYVMALSRRWVILRPTGFFGPGLRKNLLFDLRSGGRDIYFQRGSVIDYLPVERFCSIASHLAEVADNEIVNVGSGYPRRLEDILRMKPRPKPGPTDEYVFHEERLVDDRGLSLERLRRHYGESIEEGELETAMRAFVSAAPEAEAPKGVRPLFSATVSPKRGRTPF